MTATTIEMKRVLRGRRVRYTHDRRWTESEWETITAEWPHRDPDTPRSQPRARRGEGRVPRGV